MVTGLTIGIFMILTFNSSHFGLVEIHGALQRMMLILGWIWISLLGIKLIQELENSRDLTSDTNDEISNKK